VVRIVAEDRECRLARYTQISSMSMHDRSESRNFRICRRQSGPLESALGLTCSAPPLRPSGKLHPQAVGGPDGRYGRSPEGQTVTRAVPPFGAVSLDRSTI
jgi:hypothetical protein